MKFLFFTLFFTFLILLNYSSAIEDNIEKEHTEDAHTNDWAVQLDGINESDVDEYAKNHGFINLGKVLGFSDVYLFRYNIYEDDKVSSSMKRSIDYQNNVTAYSDRNYRNYPEIVSEEKAFSKGLRDSTHLVWKDRQIIKTRLKRSYSSPVKDPKWSAQWHLHGSPYSVQGPSGWDLGFTGKGVNIGIVDDGIDWSHPDFSGKYNSQASYDVNFHDNNPQPYSYDNHGTESAGCAAAAENSHCGVGSAPDAGIAGIRLLAKGTTDTDEAEALAYKTNINDIYSNSWGPTDDGRRLDGPGQLTLQAMNRAINEGRDGKGSIYVWAGGNGRQKNDNCNYDGYANLPFTISVGAIGSDGRYAYYSEPCSALMATAPSSSSSTRITTTDIKSGTHECSTSFGGTSAASPIFAGVLACVLEARPELTWRDVQGVIVHGSSLVDSSHGVWQTNGAGLHYSHNYGFGLPNIKKYATLAQSWELLPPQLKNEYNAPNQNINFQANQQKNIEFDVSDSVVVEHVTVWIAVDVASRGKCTLTLNSPSGTKSYLQLSHSDTRSNINWTYLSVANWDEDSSGTWILNVKCPKAGKIENSILTVYGH